MNNDSEHRPETLQTVLRYHEITKHRVHGYASGPARLDWATQPNPFRRYTGARLVSLAHVPVTDEPLYDDAFVRGRIVPAPVTLQTISQLFYDSLAISAWKSTGESSWALRVNPSSGNLHPTEGYLICGPIDGLCDRPMVGHYAPKEHGLEVRAEFEPKVWHALWAATPAGRFLVGLTSIQWREAWKYGQRAYRYCQHDAGHAIAAISIAAAGLGWQTRILDDLSTDALALLLGTGRDDDAESEEPDVLMAVGPYDETVQAMGLREDQAQAFGTLDWQGRANQLSPSHLDWGIDHVAAAVRRPRGRPPYDRPERPSRSWSLDRRSVCLRKVIRQRRSAVAMDRKTRITRDTFYRILQRTVAFTGRPPFDALPWTPHIHLAIFVHRVEALPSGLYVLVRDSSQSGALEKAFTRADRWQQPIGCPSQLELYCLTEADIQQTARQVSCSQDIASDGCFSLGMIAEYEQPLERHGPCFYPRLFWEAGMVGQVLYLEAEAAGLRSTGIGCYFDDDLHRFLGLRDRAYQDLYHFTVGGPIEDTRLTTLPSYPNE